MDGVAIVLRSQAWWGLVGPGGCLAVVLYMVVHTLGADRAPRVDPVHAVANLLETCGRMACWHALFFIS